MWPFKRPVCACAERVATIQSVLKRLVDDVDALEERYTSLRGLVYAKKLHKQTPAEDPGESTPETDTSKMSKAELKAFLTRTGRMVPGKPTQHQE